MKTNAYLIFDKYGFVAAKKTSNFNLAPGQRAVVLSVTIPNEAFEPAVFMKFSANVPAELCLRPMVDVDVEPSNPVGVKADDE